MTARRVEITVRQGLGGLGPQGREVLPRAGARLAAGVRPSNAVARALDERRRVDEAVQRALAERARRINDGRR